MLWKYKTVRRNTTSAVLKRGVATEVL